MQFKRIMGLENEYGISSLLGTDPITLSTRLVHAYAKYLYPEKNIRWDYDLENPLRDARGFDLTRSEVDPSLLTDEDQTIANIVIHNGARFYVDHAHPEYSAPETTNAFDAVKWDLAGDKVLKKAIELDKELNPNDPIRIFKNNVDNKGASYGTHENYLMKRATDFNKIIYFLTPFLVTRQIFTGAGRIGIGQIPQNDSFQISQRADYFETLVGLETTLRRPIINTRDEPHADSSKYRRLHLIIGDANRCDFANILKIGTTDLVLTMIEEDYLNNLDCDLVDPLQSLKDVSQNINLDKNLRLSSGNQLNSIEIQYSYLTKAIEFNKNISKSNYFAKIIEMWKSTLSALDKDTSQLIGKIDWLTKKYLIDKIKQESKSNAIDVLKSMDIQYSELTNQENIFNILIKNNIVESFYDENEIEYCELNPPYSSRAYFRANMLKKYPSYISAASWDNVILDLDPNKSLLRIPTTDPYGFNYESHSQIFNNASSIQDLVSVLSSHDAHR
jgi:proteasome accessory factor A